MIPRVLNAVVLVHGSAERSSAGAQGCWCAGVLMCSSAYVQGCWCGRVLLTVTEPTHRAALSRASHFEKEKRDLAGTG
jgi:hypothetical protein